MDFFSTFWYNNSLTDYYKDKVFDTLTEIGCSRSDWKHLTVFDESKFLLTDYNYASNYMVIDITDSGSIRISVVGELIDFSEGGPRMVQCEKIDLKKGVEAIKTVLDRGKSLYEKEIKNNIDNDSLVADDYQFICRDVKLELNLKGYIFGKKSKNIPELCKMRGLDGDLAWYIEILLYPCNIKAITPPEEKEVGGEDYELAKERFNNFVKH